MKTTESTSASTPPAVAGQVERPVRPLLTEEDVQEILAHFDWRAEDIGDYTNRKQVAFARRVETAVRHRYAESKTQYCWLVENGKQAGEGLAYRRMDQGMPTWTEDPHKAMRFVRRADAEMFAEEDEDALRIVEHGFEA